MPLCSKSLTITAESPAEIRKLDRAVQSLTGVSRSQVLGLLERRCVTLNGQPCAEPFRRLATGDAVAVRYDPSQRYRPSRKSPRQWGFDILFEDEHLIVVIKPAAWLTVPTPNGETDTLIDRVSEYLQYHRPRGRNRAHSVQRLDRGVSGVLVFAKSEAVADGLRDQFEQHKPERRYWALVAGRLAADAGTFRSHLATSSTLQRYSTLKPGAGQLAITHYQVERRLADTTLVVVRLETGRRNQIRVHFAEAGHPVLGDERYEPRRASHPRWTAPRIALHAAALAFRHPVTGKECRFETPLPAEFQAFLRQE